VAQTGTRRGECPSWAIPASPPHAGAPQPPSEEQSDPPPACSESLLSGGGPPPILRRACGDSGAPPSPELRAEIKPPARTNRCGFAATTVVVGADGPAQ